MSKSMKSIDPDERAKILKLQNELQNGDNKKVEWLYGGEKIDREAYLLGKPIDKLITESEKSEAASRHAKFTSTVDLANKIREDPLFEIKKMEIESKKRLLENPMKMRQIKELISQRSHESEKNEKIKKHDQSRERRRRKSRSSDEGSSDDGKIKKKRSKEDDYYGYHKVKKQEERRGGENSESRREAEMYKKRIEDLKKIRESKPSSNRDERDKHHVKKMSEEEKRLKLEKMRENAEWRNDVRNKNVSKYKHDDRKEEEEEKRDAGSRSAASNEIFGSMMRDGNSSIEDRIKRNVKNIQRKESSFESNFAKR